METVSMKSANRNAPPPTPPPSHRAKSIKFEDFIPDGALNEAQRAAQFLFWAAENMPKRFVPYVWIAKHAYIKPKLPRSDSAEVTLIRQKKMDQIKRILWLDYKRRTVPAPRDSEPGVRATHDHDDMANTDLVRRRRRVAGSIKQMADTHAAIDPDQMHDPLAKAMVLDMNPIVKKLNTPELIRRLELPPHKTKKKDDR